MARAAQKKPPERQTTFEIVDCVQGEPEWFKARLGIPTASMFSVMMASGKDDETSKTRTDYLYELAGETISGIPSEKFSGGAMARGKEMESAARDYYERTHLSATLTRVGFAKNGGLMKYVTVGASPDSLVEDRGSLGGLEIKTMMPKLMIKRLLGGAVMPPEHRAQVHGNMWVFQRDWWDFQIFWPKMPPFVVRVERDDVFIKQISDEAERFGYELKTLIERLRNMGATG